MSLNKIKAKSLIQKFEDVGEFGTIHVRKRTIADAGKLAETLTEIGKKHKAVPTDLFIGACILSCLVTDEGEHIAFEDVNGEPVTGDVIKVELLVTSYSSKELDLLYDKVLEVNPLITEDSIKEKKSKS